MLVRPSQERINPSLARLGQPSSHFPMNIFFRDVSGGSLWVGSAVQSPLLWDG